MKCVQQVCVYVQHKWTREVKSRPRQRVKYTRINSFQINICVCSVSSCLDEREMFSWRYKSSWYVWFLFHLYFKDNTKLIKWKLNCCFAQNCCFFVRKLLYFFRFTFWLLVSLETKKALPPNLLGLGECVFFSVNHYIVAFGVRMCDSSSSCLGGEDLWSEADSSCSGQPIHLWQFLRELLLKPHNYGRCIRWLNKEKGIFSSFHVVQYRHGPPDSF